ncbi:integrator complex subunit 4 isoform X2 [Lampetra fluviatilis]
MAAHLKKRVYEEFSKSAQQDEGAPSSSSAASSAAAAAAAKRLRLSKPSKSAALHVELSRARGPAEALNLLLHFARRPVEAESAEGVLRILLDHYYKESESSVRLKIASLLGLLTKTPGFTPDSVLDDVINALNSEKSHQVRAQLLDSLQALGSLQSEASALRARLVDVACKFLTDSYHGVRSKCLQLIGLSGEPFQPVVKEGDGAAPRDVQRILGDSFTDQDARVRTSAINAMLQLHDRGVKLDQSVYQQTCQALSDDYEQVRSAAVRLICVISQIYPESVVPVPSSNEEIRLVDDAFGKVCQVVSDGSLLVRVQAAKMLGTMQNVSEKFLEQTLDKKLMSDLRRKRSAHERSRELFTSGEFSSGRKWADDAPREELSTDAVSLINQGACGALVHGLEDELYEVRMAGVESLCSLALTSRSFATKCLDFLVDMFNDEIEDVRLQSIHALRRISTNITLRDDQLGTVLAVLEDSSRDIREALQELLCYTSVATKSGVHMALVELLKNLTKYPSDRDSIWTCLKHMGARHPTLVLSLVPELLNTHPFFDTPEPDMDDPAYIAVLLLVFNAAQSCPTMTALFPDHTLRHYTYLRDSLSHLVPSLPGCVRGSMCEAPAAVEAGDARFLQQSLERVQQLRRADTPGAARLLQLTIRDLKRLGELQPELTGAAEFSALYLQCKLLLTEALQDKVWSMAVPLYLPQDSTASNAAAQIVEHTYRLEFLFGGLEPLQVAMVRQTRLEAQALELVLQARTNQGEEPLLSRCEKFLQEVEDFQRCLHAELGRLQGGFVERLLEAMPRLACCKPAEMICILHTHLQHTTFVPMQLPPQVRQARATILEPTGESDNPLRFTAGLVLALDVDAKLENVPEPHRTVRVQVVYPDGQAQIIHPRPGDFRNPREGQHRLITQVYMSHAAWTEPCHIELSLMLAFSADSGRVGVGPAPSCLSPSPASWLESADPGPPPPANPVEGTVPLCRPVRVYVMPKPTRR